MREATSSQQEKGSIISLSGRGAAVEPPGVDSPDPREVRPGDLVRGMGKGKVEESGVKMAKGSSAGGKPGLTHKFNAKRVCYILQNMAANHPSGRPTTR